MATMVIDLYQCKWDKNKVLKTFQGEPEHINAYLKDATNIMQPVFLITTDVNQLIGGDSASNRGYNYCYIPKFDRYYWFDTTIVNANQVLLECHEDTLRSHLYHNYDSQPQFIRRCSGDSDGAKFVPEEHLSMRTDMQVISMPFTYGVDIVWPNSYYVLCTSGVGEKPTQEE